MDINFNELNIKIKELYNKISESEMNESILLSNDFIKNYDDLKLIEYKKYYSFKQTLLLVIGFLKELGLEKVFNNQLRSGKFEIYDVTNEKEIRILGNEPLYQKDMDIIVIPLKYDLEDSYNIIHEFFHSITKGKEKSLEEIVPISSEFFFRDYLEKNGISECNIEENNRLFFTCNSSIRLIILKKLFEVLENKGNINNEDLKMIYIEISSYIDIKDVYPNFLDFFNQYLKYGSYDLKYVLGTYMGEKIYNKGKEKLLNFCDNKIKTRKDFDSLLEDELCIK